MRPSSSSDSLATPATGAARPRSSPRRSRPAGGAAAGAASARRRGTAPELATVPPGDEDSENDVDDAETGDEQQSGPRRRPEQGDDAESHEAQSHDGDA